jgi:hypothetical protein
MISRATPFLALLMLFAAGCGEKGPPPGAALGTAVPVHGRITFADGNALRGGVVIFYPVEFETGGRLRYEGASIIDAKGEYTAGRNGDRMGLVPGEYVVTVEPRDVGELPGSNSASIPKLFQDKKSSTLKVTVADTDNQIDIALK